MKKEVEEALRWFKQTAEMEFRYSEYVAVNQALREHEERWEELKNRTYHQLECCRKNMPARYQYEGRIAAYSDTVQTMEFLEDDSISRFAAANEAANDTQKGYCGKATKIDPSDFKHPKDTPGAIEARERLDKEKPTDFQIGTPGKPTATALTDSFVTLAEFKRLEEMVKGEVDGFNTVWDNLSKARTEHRLCLEDLRKRVSNLEAAPKTTKQTTTQFQEFMEIKEQVPSILSVVTDIQSRTPDYSISECFLVLIAMQLNAIETWLANKDNE